MPQGVLPFQIEAERDTTDITAAAGLLPCIELMVAAGVLRSANQHVGVRAKSAQGWTDAQFLMAGALLNVLGGDGVSDLDVLEGDEGLGTIVRAAELRGLTGRERREFKRRFRGARSRTFPSASAGFRYFNAFHDAERRWVERLRQRARAAMEQPQAGRVDPEDSMPALREVLLRNYRIVYFIREDSIEVVTVFEGHKMFPGDVLLPEEG